MSYIVGYQKYITVEVTRQFRLPRDSNHRLIGTELATLANGITYISIPDGVALPIDQPPEILGSIAKIELTPELKEEIKAASPHVRLINERVAAAIAERYSLADEIKLLRTAPSPEFNAYNAYAEECRAWGRTEKARLGL